MSDRNIPAPFERFKHFKGGEYQVLMIAEDSGTGEKVVVYQALYHPYKIYTRSLEEFLSDVDRNKYPDVAQKERFMPLQRPAQAIVPAADTVNKNAVTAGDDSRVNMHSVQPSGIAARTAPQPSQQTVAGPAAQPAASTDADIQPAAEKRPEGQINPALLKFLDARTVEEKLSVLYDIRDDITPEILTPMELSLGMEPIDDTVEKRVMLIKETLTVRDQYEKRRLR
ncbi:MAG: DUF1653 domain-containing protein [Lachnospiraceae bacterium]|nr:DUF1653 domain-containing protein [Lachnospiraceae bacterium]